MQGTGSIKTSRRRPGTILCAALVALGCGADRFSRMPAPPILPEQYAVHFVDASGDATIIDGGDVEIVIDGGRSRDGFMRYIEERDLVQGPIELLILTHPHPDHYKGLHSLLASSNHRVEEFWAPGFEYSDDCRPNEGYWEFIALVRDRMTPGGVLRRPLEDSGERVPATISGESNWFGIDAVPGVRFLLLHSSKDADTEATDAVCRHQKNNASIVVMLEIQGSRYLFTGDATGKHKDAGHDAAPIDVERRLLALAKTNPDVLKADVLKAPHHGSETASSPQFIAAVQPDWVVFFRHMLLPKGRVVDRYRVAGRGLLSTREGNIVCTTRESGVACGYVDS